MSREGAGWRFWIVPHTHWDRDWYLTVEDFQIRLAHTLDEVIDVLEREPAFRFALDGQAVVLEDYRAIHPERWGRLARLVAEGQMTVGPAYVLPDEFLAGQESLVRNLLLGRQACWELGVRPAELGYVPDMFGHVAQLPQMTARAPCCACTTPAGNQRTRAWRGRSTLPRPRASTRASPTRSTWATPLWNRARSSPCGSCRERATWASPPRPPRAEDTVPHREVSRTDPVVRRDDGDHLGAR